MFEQPRRLLLESKISRRSFISRLSKAGVSVAGAGAIANSLIGAAGAAGENLPKPEQGRVVENMTGGDVMLEFLGDWGIEYLFGLAGSEEVGLLDALVDRPNIPFVTSLHENATMAMADGYSRSTGKTSIVALHSVAGAAYALGQIVGSFRDRIPVVCCVGRQATDYRGQDGFLEAADLHTLPEDYAQWTWDVLDAQTIPEVLRRAFMYAESPPGGPTFVTFSNDLWEVNVERAEIMPRSRSRVDDNIPASADHVEQVADHLMAAQLPVLFVGNEANRYECSETLAELAESIGALVMSSNKSPMSFPTTHPNYAGQFYQDDAGLAAKVDCFWSLGAHMFKRAKKSQEPLVRRDAVIMHTSLADRDVGRNYPVDTAAVANIVPTSEAVLGEIRARNLGSSAIRARKRFVEDYTQKRRRRLDDIARKEWNSLPIAVSRLMSELDRAMDEEAIIVSEVVTSGDHIRKYLRFDHTQPFVQRRRNYDTTSGVLGWGVAAAIGTKIGNPGKEVWALTGDGCFNFGSQALWSAARYEVPIGVVIFNNGEYQANRVNQVRFGGHRMKATGRFIGVNLGHPDINYVAQADTFGIEGERVSEPKHIAPALQRCKSAMAEGRPYVVDVKIARRFTGKDSDYYDFFSVAKMQNA